MIDGYTLGSNKKTITKADTTKGIGVILPHYLTLRHTCQNKINKANSMMGDNSTYFLIYR